MTLNTGMTKRKQILACCASVISVIIFCCLLYLFISSFNSKIKDISAKSMTQYVAISYLAYCDSLNWNDIPLELPPLKLSNVEQDKQTGELLDVWKRPYNIMLKKNGDDLILVVRSCGKDGIMMSEDDIVFEFDMLRRSNDTLYENKKCLFTRICGRNPVPGVRQAGDISTLLQF